MILGQDSQCISRNGIKAGDRVLVIDDLVATGVSNRSSYVNIYYSEISVLY